MPVIAPWLTANNPLEYMKAGAGLGISSRAQDISQMDAGQRLRYSYDSLAADQDYNRRKLAQDSQLKEAAQALKGAYQSELMGYRERSLADKQANFNETVQASKDKAQDAAEALKTSHNDTAAFLDEVDRGASVAEAATKYPNVDRLVLTHSMNAEKAKAEKDGTVSGNVLSPLTLREVIDEMTGQPAEGFRQYSGKGGQPTLARMPSAQTLKQTPLDTAAMVAKRNDLMAQRRDAIKSRDQAAKDGHAAGVGAQNAIIDAIDKQLQNFGSPGQALTDATKPQQNPSFIGPPAPVSEPAQGGLGDKYKIEGLYPGGPPGPAKPTTKEEYDALPAGSLYIDPDDGKTHRKQGGQ